MNYTCPWCNYTGKEGQFLTGTCPACCCDLDSGKIDPNAIPLVFHESVHIEAALIDHAKLDSDIRDQIWFNDCEGRIICHKNIIGDLQGNAALAKFIVKTHNAILLNNKTKK